MIKERKKLISYHALISKVFTESITNRFSWLLVYSTRMYRIVILTRQSTMQKLCCKGAETGRRSQGYWRKRLLRPIGHAPPLPFICLIVP
jgi:hypothetical protein